MLTKEWIRKTIYDALAMEVWSSTRKRPFMQVRGDWGLGAIEAVEAITQAAEEDRIDAMHSQYLIDQEETAGYKATIEELQADDAIQGLVQRNELLDDRIADLRVQVATESAKAGELAWLLHDLKDSWWDKHYPADIFVGGPDSDDGVNEIVRIREAINQALSVAPKVLCSTKLRIEPGWRDGNGLDKHFYDPKATLHGEVGWLNLDFALEEETTMVDLMLVDCSVKAGYQRSSEQSQDSEHEIPD